MVFKKGGSEGRRGKLRLQTGAHVGISGDPLFPKSKQMEREAKDAGSNQTPWPCPRMSTGEIKVRGLDHQGCRQGSRGTGKLRPSCRF